MRVVSPIVPGGTDDGARRTTNDAGSPSAARFASGVSTSLMYCGELQVLLSSVARSSESYSRSKGSAVLVNEVLPASVWVEVEAPAVEVDRGLEVLPVAETASGVPDPLDLRVQAFGRRVGDPVAQVGEDVRQVRLEHPRLLDHGLEPRVGRPEVPVAEEPAGGSDVAVLPEVRGRLLERPGAGDLERAVA